MKYLIHLVLVIGLISTLSCTKEEKVEEKKIRATLISVTLTESDDYSLISNNHASPKFDLWNEERGIFYHSENYKSVKMPVKWDDIDILLNDQENYYSFSFRDSGSRINGGRPIGDGLLTLEDVYPETEVEIRNGSTVFTVELFYR